MLAVAVPKPGQLLGQASVVALVWVTLYFCNDWLFSNLAISDRMSWVFLPAALRMLAVMLLGWVGAVGLFVGSLLTGWLSVADVQIGSLCLVSGISALAPLLAYVLCAKLLGIRTDLRGLDAYQLLCLSIVSAALSASLHSLHFSAIDYVHNFSDSFVPMFAGDLVGTLIVLYLGKIALGFINPNRHKTI